MQYVIKRLLVDRLLANPALEALFPQRMVSEISEEFCEPWGCLLIATPMNDDTAIVGMGGMRRVSEEICEIRRLVVAPPFQRQGIGQMLLSGLIDFAERAGYLKSIVEVPPSIQSLAAFYRRMGFTRCDGPTNGQPGILAFVLRSASTIN